MPIRTAPEREGFIATGIEGLTISSRRIRYEQSYGGFTVVSIMLDELTSCGAARRSYGILLALAAIVAVMGLIIGLGGNGTGPVVSVFGLVIAAVLVFVFFATRRTVLEFCSRGGAEIIVRTGDMKPDDIIGLIDRIEMAKGYLLNPPVLPSPRPSQTD